MSVEPGQLWASTDKRDVDAGHNQQRLVVEVSGRTAWLTGAPGYTTRIRIQGNSIPRHRYVRDATPAEIAHQGGIVSPKA